MCYLLMEVIKKVIKGGKRVVGGIEEGYGDPRRDDSSGGHQV